VAAGGKGEGGTNDGGNGTHLDDLLSGCMLIERLYIWTGDCVERVLDWFGSGAGGLFDIARRSACFHASGVALAAKHRAEGWLLGLVGPTCDARFKNSSQLINF